MEIHGETSVPFTGAARVTVLDATGWSWVLVKSEQGEMGLNFDHEAAAKNIATVG
ncbi:MAG TPA: hypothetical protein VGL72_33500 [Bryobacteraceae bacterium]